MFARRHWPPAAEGRLRLFAPVERLAALQADRVEVFWVTGLEKARLQLAEALFQFCGLRVPVELRETSAQFLGVAVLDFGERDLASQLLLLALHRLELFRDRHELLRLRAEGPRGSGNEERDEAQRFHGPGVFSPARTIGTMSAAHCAADSARSTRVLPVNSRGSK